VNPSLRIRSLLAIVALACASVGADRPLLPDYPLGTGSSSFGGGGAAHASGLNSVFDNPAALSVHDAFQAETGLMGLTAGMSPYFLFGSRGGDNSSYAAGYFYDARGGDPAAPAPPRQGMVAGASWDAKPWATFGATVRSAGTGDGVGLDGFGIDEDVGALFRPASAFWTGLAVHDLQEAGVGQEPEGYRTQRSYAIAMGTGLSGINVAGLTFHDPDAYYELRTTGPFTDPRFAHALSAASGFTPGGRIGFRGTLLLQPGGDPGFAVGTFANLPMGRAAIVFAYTLHAGSFSESGEAEPSHSFSLNFRLGRRLDPLPPSVEVRADKVTITPGDPSDSGQVHFRLNASDKAYAPRPVEAGMLEKPEGPGMWPRRKGSLEEGLSLAEGRILDWSLIIHEVGPDGLAGPEVRVFHGRDLPPRVIRWDATDEKNQKLPIGFYAFRMAASDLAGNRAETGWQLIQVVAP